MRWANRARSKCVALCADLERRMVLELLKSKIFNSKTDHFQIRFSIIQLEKEDCNQRHEQIGGHHLGSERVCGEPEEQQGPVRDRSTASGTESARLDLSRNCVRAFKRKHLSISANFNWHRYFHNTPPELATLVLDCAELPGSSLQFIFSPSH